MGTTSEKLTYLNTTKGKIKDSINLTGANITTEPFRQYSTKLENAYIDIINNGTDTLYNNFPKVSGEGTSLTLNNTYQAPMRNNLKGNTSQTGTPTPTSPIPVNVVSGSNTITIEGLNLADFNNLINIGSNVTHIWNEDVLTVSNSSGTYRFAYLDITNLIKINPDKIIRLDYDSIDFSQSNAPIINLEIVNNGNTSYSSMISNTGAINTYTIPSNTSGITKVRLRFLSNNSSTSQAGTIVITKPILHFDSTKILYEPYQGNTYNIDLPVKNLFDNDLQDNLAHPNCTYSYVNGEIVVSATGSDCYLGEQTSVGQSWSSIKGQLIEVEPNTTYTYSITNPMFAKNFVVFYDSNKVSTKSNYIRQASYTFTTESTTKYISMRIGNENSVSGTTYKLNVMLEKGSKTNTYQPYGTTPIELCKIGTYQDYFYKDSDKWYLHKEIEKIANYNGETITTDYISTTGQLTTGATIYYGLSTPTTTEITDTTLINQLEELYIAKSKENQTNISQINNDLGFIISASALKKG